MNKKIIWILTIVLIIEMLLIIYKLANNKNEEEKLSIDRISESLQTATENTEGEVTDECINEWDAYNEYLEGKIKEASNNIVEDDTHYLLKNIEGHVEVYCITEENGEYLYKKTNISTEYLSNEDLDNLGRGIEIVGIEGLNKILEDFE